MPRRTDLEQRDRLIDELRTACISGDFRVGELLPTSRQLAERYHVSQKTIALVVQDLAAEGLLYTVPRVGTFLGRPAVQASEPYLVVSHHERTPRGFFDNFQIGFEDRIAQLGGMSLTLTEDETLWHLEQGNLPNLAGVFEIGAGLRTHFSPAGQMLMEKGIPATSFGPLEDSPFDVDLIDFDNEDGGAQAARHMLSMGHRDIAFLALHTDETVKRFRWSMQRERGWQRAMQQAGQNTDGAIFHPYVNSGREHEEHEEQILTAVPAAEELLSHSKFTAIVAVNVFAAHALLRVLRERKVPVERWPAMMCFDVSPRGAASVLSYLRLPWEKVGTEAAQVLWERRTGRLTGESQQRLVPMQLIPRLTCRSDWASASGLAHSHLSATAPWA